MYVVYQGDQIIGYNKDYDVVHKFLSSLDSELQKNCTMVTMKKKDIKKMVNYQDLVLVKRGWNYIPYGYVEVVDDDVKSYVYWYKETIQQLYGVIEEGNLPSKDIKCVQRTIEILESKADEIDLGATYTSYLPELKEQHDHMRNI